MRKSFLLVIGVFLITMLAAVIGCTGTAGPAGPSGSVGPAGSAGPAGPQGLQGPLAPGVERGIDVDLSVSNPSNGNFFDAGDRIVVSLQLKDSFGETRTKEDFSTIGLYMYGPQETAKTVTAVKLLNASTDRSQSPHHYIDLLKNDAVTIKGNILEYTLQPVSDEEPGTYTIAVRAYVADEPLSQAFELVDVQIGTDTVEAQIVEREKCAACHLGTISGQFYLHHVDPGRSPTGSPALDSWPVRTCKACHNNDGYAAYRLPSDRDVRVPDPIVNRIHGVHSGSNLESVLNVGSEEEGTEGVFADYLDVHFPANVKNCTTCHVDNRWKTEPSRVACGACHDNVSFNEVDAIPETAEAHPGGPQPDDSSCAACHTPDSGGAAPISVAHKVDPPPFKHVVGLSMSRSNNGKFYVAGETPTVTITIKDAATGEIIDPNNIREPVDSQNYGDNEWRRANLYVSGPRYQTKPVLTNTATHDEYDHSYANNDFRVMLDSDDEDPRITRSSTEIVYQLDDVAGLNAGTYTAFVETMPAVPLGGWAIISFQVGTDTREDMVATNCTTCHADTRMHASYFAVQFNPNICKNCHDYERQMPGKTAWTDSNSGFGAAPLARRIHGVHFGNYLDKPEEVHQTYDYSNTIFPQDVRNCTKCHDDNPAWKENPSRLACNACHDTDDAIAHTSLMTQDITPNDPWSGDELESCKVCHGPGRDFSVEKVHNISDPYLPPYPR